MTRPDDHGMPANLAPLAWGGNGRDELADWLLMRARLGAGHHRPGRQPTDA